MWPFKRELLLLTSPAYYSKDKSGVAMINATSDTYPVLTRILTLLHVLSFSTAVSSKNVLKI